MTLDPQLKAALAKIVKKLRQDENPLEDGVPVETYGYEATYNQALNDMALALQPEIERLELVTKISAAKEILEYRSYKIGEGAPRLVMPRGECRRFVDEFDFEGHINTWEHELAQLTQLNKKEGE